MTEARNTPPAGEAWPVEIRIRPGGRALCAMFDDGRNYEIPAEMLRVLSPSAEVRGHGPHDRKIVGGKKEVAIVSAGQAGNYALRLGFDDGHASGIYTWAYLQALGRDGAGKWAEYLAALARAGLSRERPGVANAADFPEA